MYIFLLPFFANPNAFPRHFHLVNRANLETVLNTADFINEEDGQVRAAHKILGYTPIQKSFADPRHVISANHPRLSKITVVEQGFLISGGSPVPEGIPLVDLPPSPPASEGEGEFGSFEKGFEVFEQADPFEDPSGDLGDPALSEAELSLVGTSS